MRTFYIIALLLWILGSSYWAKNSLCGDKGSSKPSATSTLSGAAAGASGDCDYSLVFEDGDLFSAVSATNILFDSGTSNIKLPKSGKESLKETLIEVAQYLGDNPDRTLLLEGGYFEKEKNKTNEENLGTARATAFAKYLVSTYNVDKAQLNASGRLYQNLDCYYNSKSNLVTKGITASFEEK